MSTIRPVPGKHDWFFAPTEIVKPIFGASGVHVEGGRCRIHRTHLPLLDIPEAQAHLFTGTNDSAVWAARNARTEALGFTLRTTQHQGIDFIEPRRGTLLGDDMRLGKTLTGAMSHDPARGPLVVIAPLQTRGVWLAWLKRVFPDLTIGKVLGRKFDLEVLKHPIIFMHYDVIKDWQAPIQIGTLIFDEAHLLTNPKSKRTNAAIFHAVNAAKVIAMTGTPIWNMPPDLWAILTLIVPGGFGDYYSFCNRYGAPEPSAYGMKYTGISHEAELRKRIDEIMLRRRWVDVADDIPPITRNVLVANIDEKTKKKLDIIAAEIHSDRKNTAANLAHYRRVLSLFKVPTVVGEAKRMLDADESVVLWAWHKETADALLERIGERGYLIHGDISITKRDEIIAKWKQSKAEGRAVALIATMSVAQVGLDFSGASPIFAEIDWTPAVIAQTEMRTFDPKRPMNVTFVVADHLIEQRILRSLIAKLGAANPLGVGAAIDAIDALRTAVFGTPEEADLTRLLDAFLSEAE